MNNYAFTDASILKTEFNNFSDNLFLQRLDSEEFIFSIMFHVNPNNELEEFTYSPNYNGKIHFCTKVPSLFHEIAHFIEIDKERFLLEDFGLPIYSYNEMNDSNKAKYFLERESRVSAIENLISDSKINRYRVKSSNIFKYIKNSKNCPFSSYDENVDFYTKYQDEYAKTLDKDYLFYEFNRRLDIVLKKLHT